jgi:hypothetical protein
MLFLAPAEENGLPRPQGILDVLHVICFQRLKLRVNILQRCRRTERDPALRTPPLLSLLPTSGHPQSYRPAGSLRPRTALERIPTPAMQPWTSAGG